MAMLEKIKLTGFNHLTKSLGVNIYKLCYAPTSEQKNIYINDLDKLYDAQKLSELLSRVAEIIDAQVLNVAVQDYDPRGASATLLVGQSLMKGYSVVGHLDKSHITVHTYPEIHPVIPLSSFRVDMDISTCGDRSPLQAIDYIIRQFDAEVVIFDYRMRGFLSNDKLGKYHTDHSQDIQTHITDKYKAQYKIEEDYLVAHNLCYVRMMKKVSTIDEELFDQFLRCLS